MSFCKKCGRELPDGAKFCLECGEPIDTSANDEERQKKFYGKILKCPNCGETVESFVVKCPTCGHEFRNVTVSSSIQDFSNKLSAAVSLSEREAIIRDYPIPNTKEDITEFLIIASSNIKSSENDDIFEAWNAKAVQCYRKAEISFKDDASFARIQSIYNETVSYYRKRRNINTAKKVGKYALDASTVLPQTIITGAWAVTLIVLLPLCNTNLDKTGQNGYHVFYVFICLVGAIVLPYVLDCSSSLPKTVFLIGTIITVIVLIPLTHTYVDNSGASPFQLLLVFELICCGVVFFRTIRRSKKKQGGK